MLNITLNSLELNFLRSCQQILFLTAPNILSTSFPSWFHTLRIIQCVFQLLYINMCKDSHSSRPTAILHSLYFALLFKQSTWLNSRSSVTTAICSRDSYHIDKDSRTHSAALTSTLMSLRRENDESDFFFSFLLTGPIENTLNCTSAEG